MPKMSHIEALELIQIIKDSLSDAISNENAANALAKKVWDAQFKWPEIEEVSKQLLELAGTPALPELLTNRLLQVLKPFPNLAVDIATFLKSPYKWVASTATILLCDIATREAGEILGAAFPFPSWKSQLELQLKFFAMNSEYLDAFLTAIGEKRLSNEVMMALVQGILESLNNSWIKPPISPLFTKLILKTANPLVKELSQVPCTAPKALWAEEKYAENTFILKELLYGLALCEPNGDEGQMLSTVLGIADPYLLEAATRVQLHRGIVPPESQLLQVAEFPHTRWLLEGELIQLNRLSLMPASERSWIRRAEGWLADYLLLEVEWVPDTFELVTQRTKTMNGQQVVVAIFRYSQKADTKLEPGFACIWKVFPDADDPLSMSNIGVFGDTVTDEKVDELLNMC